MTHHGRTHRLAHLLTRVLRSHDAHAVLRALTADGGGGPGLPPGRTVLHLRGDAGVRTVPATATGDERVGEAVARVITTGRRTVLDGAHGRTRLLLPVDGTVHGTLSVSVDGSADAPGRPDLATATAGASSPASAGPW
ncbi:hypothetical protein ACIHFC_13780 [Streptomyces sp. NPDC052013]|uniref:hypothetical protein n=1 Tax=Streptomyces sp. NPDC052013 TaxID=3365679 RepID=UPI0037D60CD7